MINRAALALLFSFAGHAMAEEISLQSPIDCDLTSTCYIQQYMDRDPSEGVRDYRCSGQSYDGHKGTDFALRSTLEIDKGVAVLAAADGVVEGTRDGMADIEYTPEIADQVKNRECGNGVRVSHGNGWLTQYCHLRQGSVSVREGQKVAAGDRLGEVGMSGQASFPHVHFSVRKDATPVDPFGPDGSLACDGATDETLWSEPPMFQPGGLISVGFADQIPSYADVKSGAAASTQLLPEMPNLVIYGFAHGVKEGDIMHLSITGPEGEVIADDIRLAKAQARSFRAIGKKRRQTAWPAGTYKGVVALLRNGETIARRELEMQLK